MLQKLSFCKTFLSMKNCKSMLLTDLPPEKELFYLLLWWLCRTESFSLITLDAQSRAGQVAHKIDNHLHLSIAYHSKNEMILIALQNIYDKNKSKKTKESKIKRKYSNIHSSPENIKLLISSPN